MPNDVFDDPDRRNDGPGGDLAFGGDRTPDNTGVVLDELGVVELCKDASVGREVDREVVGLDTCAPESGPG